MVSMMGNLWADLKEYLKVMLDGLKAEKTVGVKV